VEFRAKLADIGEEENLCGQSWKDVLQAVGKHLFVQAVFLPTQENTRLLSNSSGGQYLPAYRVGGLYSIF
jgi:hypothetical protein